MWSECVVCVSMCVSGVFGAHVEYVVYAWIVCGVVWCDVVRFG